jgi:hypothetical protein
MVKLRIYANKQLKPGMLVRTAKALLSSRQASTSLNGFTARDSKVRTLLLIWAKQNYDLNGLASIYIRLL